MNIFELDESLRDENPCWKGYHPVGTKKKNGRTVPNCVPNSNEAANPAQQAAIAIAKKKKQGITEFAGGSGRGDDDGGEDPYKYPEPQRYRRSIKFFGQFEADHFDEEEFDKATGEFRGYWNDQQGRDQIAYFKFDNPQRTGDDDPGMGWYYEPQNESVAAELPPAGYGDYSKGATKPDGTASAQRQADREFDRREYERKEKERKNKGVAEGHAPRGEYSRVLSALGLYYPDKFSMEELNTPDWHRVIANKADVPVEYAGKVIDDFTRPVDGYDDYDDDQDVREGKETPEKELERLKLRQNAEHGRASLQRQAATQARIRELEKQIKGKKQGVAEAIHIDVDLVRAVFWVAKEIYDGAKAGNDMTDTIADELGDYFDDVEQSGLPKLKRAYAAMRDAADEDPSKQKRAAGDALLTLNTLIRQGTDRLRRQGMAEVSLGDYHKKASMGRALAQMGAAFAGSPEEREREKAIAARRERGLARAKTRIDRVRAAADAKSKADALAKDRAELPQMKAELAKLQSRFDPSFEYSDDHSFWREQKDLQGRIQSLKQRIARAEEGMNENMSGTINIEFTDGSTKYMRTGSAGTNAVKSVLQYFVRRKDIDGLRRLKSINDIDVTGIIQRIIGGGNTISLESKKNKKPMLEALDQEFQNFLSRARHMYPDSQDNTEAFMRYVHDQLEHEVKVDGNQSQKISNLENRVDQLLKKINSAQAPVESKEADYGPEYQDMVKRVGKLAKQGPMKTVWDPVKRVYKNVPVKDVKNG